MLRGRRAAFDPDNRPDWRGRARDPIRPEGPVLTTKAEHNGTKNKHRLVSAKIEAGSTE